MRFRRLAASLWTLLILVACTIPGSELPDLDFDVIDKVGHYILFGGYGWLWMAALPTTRPRLWVVLGSGVLLAIGSEIYQGLLPWERSPDVFDALFNLLGLASAVALYLVSNQRRSNFESP